MIKFEIGKKYYCTSICDHNARWEYTVTKRTEKSIWIAENGVKEKRVSLKEYDNSEMVYPTGKYSMCPVLRAERVVA